MDKPRAKRILKLITPPILLEYGQKLWQRLAYDIGFHTFEGHYHTFQDVPATTNGYNDSYLANRQVQAFRPNLRDIDLPENLPRATIDVNGKTILPLLALIELNEFGELTILDFGGQLGVGLACVLNGLMKPLGSFLSPPKNRFKFHIVETPAMAAAIRPVLNEELRCKFDTAGFVYVHETIPTLSCPPTIVNIAGCIQYVEDYERVLTDLCALGSKYILITDTPMRLGERYARLQKNLRREIVQWVFNYDAFLDLMIARNYEPVFRICHDLPYTHYNPPTGAPACQVSVVFRRKATF